MDPLLESSSKVCLTVQCVDIKTAFLLVRDVHKIFWVFGRTNQIQLCEDLVSHIKGVHGKDHITNLKVQHNEYIAYK